MSVAPASRSQSYRQPRERLEERGAPFGSPKRHTRNPGLPFRSNWEISHYHSHICKNHGFRAGLKEGRAFYSMPCSVMVAPDKPVGHSLTVRSAGRSAG